MADRTAGGRPVDDRGVALRIRRFEYEARQLELTKEKLELDILTAEDNIERTRESIAAIDDQVEGKLAVLAAYKAQLETTPAAEDTT